MNARVVALGTVVITVATIAGCRKNESYGAGGSAGATTAAPAATRAPTAEGGSAAASTGMTDANIVYILDQANSSDSARGALAATKGTSSDVKSFGKLMVGEHHMLRAEGQALAQKLNVNPEEPGGDQSEQQAKQELDSLNAMAKGKAWDKAYIDYEVTYHEQVLETAKKALGATQTPDLKSLIEKAAPVLQKHLDRAKAIQKKLG